MTQARTGERTSLAQRGVWFTERAVSVGSAYHLALTVVLDGALDLPALERAVARVVARQPMLAAAFADDGGVPVIVPATTAPVLRTVALPDGGVDRFVATEVARGFDTQTGPLSRFTLARLDDDRYLLLVVAHHLIFDGTSKDLLLAELSAAYAGALDAPIDAHERHVAAQESRIEELRDEARAFWRDRWREAERVTLPHATSNDTGAVALRFTLDLGLDRDLHSAAGSVGVTRFEWLLATVHALLWRYGNAEPGVAVDLSTRTSETSDHIGLWVNELPVRVVPTAAQTWREFVIGVRAEVRDIYRFREVPLSRAVTGLSPRVAVCPVSVSYRRRVASVEFRGLSAAVDWLVFPQAARNELHVQIVDGPDGAEVSLQCPAGGAWASRIAGHLRTLLRGTVCDPDSALGDLPILDAREVEESRAWNDTARPVPAITVVGLFEDRARITPDATALVHRDTILSYCQLNAAADRIAHGLHRRGIGPGDLVAVTAQRGPDLVTALLGVLKAGAAYLPLDPAYPPRRLEFIVGDAAAALTLSDAVIAELLADVAEPEPDGAPATNPTDLAYVIYTSGSTGQPKGVEITHASLVNLLLAMRDLVEVTAADRWLSLTSSSFDISALEMFLPLITGACVVIAPELTGREGAALDRLIRAERVTHVQATPSSWHLLLDAGFDGSDVVGMCGGEHLPVPLATRLRARLRRLFHVYGPTETTIWSTGVEIPSVARYVAIGRPLANTTVYVLDERMCPVPVGIGGELYIGGAGLARGYRGRAKLTSERFVADPRSGERLYRTGDRARFAADGELEFLGRIDNQVKLRGHRIEPGEIEQHIVAFGGVAQAAVALREDTPGDPRLVAYIVGTGVDIAALRAHLAALLPRHMLPSGFTILERLPRTPNGKLDRAALPAPPPTIEVPTPVNAPDGDVVEQVAAIWREVLRIDDIALDDSLFDLGGHSLTITQITARIRKHLGVEVPFDVFFDTPTVEGIAEAVSRQRQEQP